MDIESYYDVDSIITDGQKLDCQFSIKIPGLGYIEDNPGGDIEKDATIQLPFYLASFLAIESAGSEQLLQMHLPSSCSELVINALKADPRLVNLHKQNTQFYEFAAQYFDLVEEDEVMDVLIETLKQRAVHIADFAHNAEELRVGTGLEFMKGLSSSEKELFRSIHSGAEMSRHWLLGASKKDEDMRKQNREMINSMESTDLGSTRVRTPR